ncbi:MAG: VapC toxin family PIN domain ribonuclease [SAR202 cluster bacterium Io17-Chloro-G2]|nr:MAG: VapC toxin family PIN domain ribonuclease [SAR202 cluster bacterium Io17-Chloro-G2]
MHLIDANILVYVHREDAPQHSDYFEWFSDLAQSDQPFAITDLIFSGFLRVVTHQRIFAPPSPMAAALAFANDLRNHPNCVSIAPGKRHWDIFTKLCREANTRGNLIPDAYLAALAIESGSDLVTADRDFSRFPGLRVVYPLMG